MSIKDRTLEAYKRVGSMMRLFKEVGTKLYVDAYPILPASERAKLYRALRKINEVCSAADERMFMDHPYIGHEYVDVFYGNLQDPPLSTVDAEVKNLARAFADALFKGVASEQRRFENIDQMISTEKFPGVIL